MPAPAVNLYASYGKGFETPTLNDLAYRSVNGSLPGLNIALQPARSNNYEVGIKAGKGAVRAELAGFYIETHDELAVLQNFNGRAVEQNIGETARHGAELAVDADWVGGFSARARLYLHPRRRGAGVRRPAWARPACPPRSSPAATCPRFRATRCTSGSPGAMRRLGFSTTVEEQGRAGIFADDRNTAFAPGYWETDWRAGSPSRRLAGNSASILRLDNLTNRAYVGSVIVNQSNARYFEPAPGRTALIMFTAKWRID